LDDGFCIVDEFVDDTPLGDAPSVGVDAKLKSRMHHKKAAPKD